MRLGISNNSFDPSSTKPQRGAWYTKFLLKDSLVYAAALCVSLFAAIAIGLLQHQSTLHRESQLTLEQIRCAALELDENQQAALSHPENLSKMAEHQNLMMQLSQNLVNKYSALSSNAVETKMLRRSYYHYAHGLNSVFSSLQRGDTFGAHVLSETVASLRFRTLMQAINNANVVSDDAAERSNLFATIGTGVGLIGSAVAISFLFSLFSRTQRDFAALSFEADQRALRKSEQRFRSLVSNASDIILILDRGGKISYLSPAGEQLWQDMWFDLSQSSVFDVTCEEDRDRLRELLWAVSGNSGEIVTDEIRLLKCPTDLRHFEVILNNCSSVPGIEGVVMTCHDISERRTLLEQLSFQAYHDSLTGLPNRLLFMHRLERAVNRAERSHGLTGILFLDLDNFKIINDSLGHQIGDQLLIAVAERLQSCVREKDTVARLGGDEFTIVMENVHSNQDVLLAVERIRARLAEPVEIDGRQVVADISIGIVISEGGQDQPQDLMKNADTAMYQAKIAGKGQYVVFDRSMKHLAIERLDMETDMRRAIEKGEFRVHFQPILRISDGSVAELEALVRWEHPTRGMISPAMFIPLAEETGLIVPLGTWVMRESCRQLVRWHEEFPALKSMGISVNLSGRQLVDSGLVDSVQRVIRETGLDSRLIKLEITESIMMQDIPLTILRLRELYELGVRLAVDDFGTGYSSLCYLNDFPVDTLKIDRAFVQRLGQQPEDQAIVEAIITLGKNLSMHVTSEGIETDEQLQILRDLQCDLGQGFLFSKPLDVLRMDKYLASAASEIEEQSPNRRGSDTRKLLRAA